MDAWCAVVLAGGAGTRAGGADKGWLDWQGKPLIEHALQQLHAAGIAGIAISANRNLERYRALAPVLVDDQPGYPGPLAGLVCALRWAPAPWLFTLPVDVPRWPQELPTQLRATAAAANASCAVARGARRREPLFAIYRRELSAQVASAFDRGERAVWRLQDALACVEVPAGAGASFENLNELPA